MSHKKSKNKQRQNQYKGYNQNQQASYSGEDGLMSEKYKENSKRPRIIMGSYRIIKIL